MLSLLVQSVPFTSMLSQNTSRRLSKLRTVDEDDEGFRRPVAPRRNNDDGKQKPIENSNGIALLLEDGRSKPVYMASHGIKRVVSSEAEMMSFSSDNSSFLLIFHDDEESSVFLDERKKVDSSSSLDNTVKMSNTSEYVMKKKLTNGEGVFHISEVHTAKTGTPAIQIRASTAEEAPMPTKLRPQTVVYVPGPGIMDDRRSDTTHAPHSERHPETQETTQRIGDSDFVTAEIVDTFQTEYDMRQKIMREAVCAEVVTQADIQSVRRKQLCIFIVMILLLIGGGLALGLLMPGRNRKSTTIQHETYPPSNAPSAPPTSIAHRERYDAFEEILRPLVGASLDYEDSPQQKALAWLVDDDVGTTLGDYIVERYILVVLYFALSGPEWTKDYSFSSEEEHCLWNDGDNGVFCDDSSVSYVKLSTNNLTGAIPPEIGHLTNLILLYISENAIEGKLPPSLGKLTKLRHFDGSVNQLIGSIPSEIFQISSIKAVWLDDNRLTGWLPDSVINATRLEYLSVANNKLNGTTHNHLSGLDSLKALDLTNNEFVGPLPSFGANASIQTIYLDDNLFTGSIPISIGNCENLQTLSIYNALLTGSIPFELAALPALTWIDLENNKLSGIIPPFEASKSSLKRISLNSNSFSGKLDDFFRTNSSLLTDVDFGNNWIAGNLPESIGLHTSLEFLSLGNNSLTGTLPTTLGLLTKLDRALMLNNNMLHGNIPTELGRLVNVPYMTLSFNNLTGPIPSELGSMTNLSSFSCAVNALVGTIPTELAGLSALETMRLQFNSLTGDMSLYCSRATHFLALEADCLSGVNCTCCTSCCGSDYYCQEQ